jgi:hypothetical protein
MSIGIAFIDLYSFFYRCAFNFRYVFSIDDVRFYVADDDGTRRQFGDAVAYAIGTSVYARSRRALTRAVIRHELKHVEQARQHGLWWPFRYWAEDSRNGYHRNKYERAARRAEKNG